MDYGARGQMDQKPLKARKEPVSLHMFASFHMNIFPALMDSGLCHLDPLGFRVMDARHYAETTLLMCLSAVMFCCTAVTRE